jgi:hypothetical protein
MVRVTRIAVAAVLALAIAALPVVLDRCTESCEAHQSAVASTPPCHHLTATGAQMSPEPARCGHDHSATPAVSAKSPAPSERAFDSIATVDSQLTVALPSAASIHVRPDAPPDSSPSLDARSLPLRV